MEFGITLAEEIGPNAFPALLDLIGSEDPMELTEERIGELTEIFAASGIYVQTVFDLIYILVLIESEYGLIQVIKANNSIYLRK
jgi:hypothetical protein